MWEGKNLGWRKYRRVCQGNCIPIDALELIGIDCFRLKAMRMTVGCFPQSTIPLQKIVPHSSSESMIHTLLVDPKRQKTQ